MAKKRVHEIAKERGIPSKEVLAVLQRAGLDVKAAASSVDESDVERAFSNGADAPKAAASDGAEKAAAEAKAPPGDSKPKAEAPPKEQPAAQSRPKAEQRAPREQKPSGDQPRSEQPRQPDSRQQQPRQDKPAEQRPQRPQRRPDQGGRGGGPGGRRRVVIDSQASRRQQGPPPVQQPPRRGRGRRRRTPWVEPDLTAQPEAPVEEAATQINSGATVKEVAESLGLGAPEVIKKLMELGEMATLTQTLSDDAIQVLADEFEKKIEIRRAADDVEEEPEFEDEDEALVDRPPVVTIMGHVDHGKTSLLDAIRHSEVVAGEAGGITQHIGAYQVRHNGKSITFLDTPGHQAFTAMRARGAQVTDIAVIVVAADDGVMPQTEEAIDHAKAADVPIMIAVNKIDKEGAQPDRVRTEMTTLGLQPEEWGGDTVFVDVSARTKEGLENLLETIQVVADLQELKANPDTDASGVVIESKLDPGRGPVVTVLIQRGTLEVGDAIVAGAHWGKVRAMHDYAGNKVK